MEISLKACRAHGIDHSEIPPHTPALDPAEKAIQDVDNMGRPALSDSHLDDGYLMEAYSWAAYTRNRMSVRRHNKHVASSSTIAATPYEMIKGHAPSVKHMLPFGCTVFVNAPARKRGKALPCAHHSEPGILLGYANPFDRHYRIELLNERRSIITSMHVDADLVLARLH